VPPGGHWHRRTQGPKRNRRLSGSSAAEIVGCYPNLSRGAGSRAVSFVLAASRFGMTARGAAAKSESDSSFSSLTSVESYPIPRDSTRRCLEERDGKLSTRINSSSPGVSGQNGEQRFLALSYGPTDRTRFCWRGLDVFAGSILEKMLDSRGDNANVLASEFNHV